MFAVRRQLRACGNTVAANRSAVENMFKDWAAGNVEAAKSHISPKAMCEYASSKQIDRIPFTGKQSAHDFMDKLHESLTIKDIKTHGILVDEHHFSAVVECNSIVNRTKKERAIQTLYHGKVEEGRILGIVARPETGLWEEAFSPHGPSIKGTERDEHKGH